MEAREGYKKTELGWIPEEWDVSELGNHVKSFAGGTPKRNEPKYFGGNIPWIKSTELNQDKIFITEEYITEDGLNGSAAKIFEKGSILIALYGATAGKVSISMIRATSNQAVLSINTTNNILTNCFIYHFLKGNRHKLINICQGSGQPNLSKNVIDNLILPLPPLPEQQKIAEILTTVDDKISSIEDRIKQTEQLKKGLMEKLLTEGIGHTEFKDTEIGRIPASWDVFRIGEIGKVKGGKRLPKGALFSDINTGLPYIRAGDLKNGTVLTENVKYLTTSIQKKIKHYTIRSSDTYITIVGAYIGDVGTVPPELDGANLTENAAKICDLKKVSNLYLAYFLKSNLGKQQIKNFIGEGAQPKLALFRIENILLPIPSLFEQKQIADILSAVDDKLNILQSKKANYETLKKGLMEQLLTGKIRVKV